MADAFRTTFIVILGLQCLGLLWLTFRHSRERRYHPAFSRWWIHAYGLSVAYTGLAYCTARSVFIRYGDPWSWQSWSVAITSTVGAIAVGGAIWLWLHDDARRDYGS